MALATQKKETQKNDDDLAALPDAPAADRDQAPKSKRADLQAGRTYWSVMALMALVLVALAIRTAESVHHRHETYQKLQAAHQEYHALKEEEVSLIVEQQAFSATPNVARRAVVELGMFYPSARDTVVVQEP